MSSKILVDEIAPKTTGQIIKMPAGSLLQIQYGQSVTGTSQSFSANTYTKLTSFPSVTITPSSTSSKIMIDVMWTGEFGVVGNTWSSVFMLYRDDTLINGNTDSGYNYSGIACPTTSYTSSDDDSTQEKCTFRYFDEPNTTSEITYYLGVKATTADTIYINRTVNNSTINGYERTTSHITATEIAG